MTQNKIAVQIGREKIQQDRLNDLLVLDDGNEAKTKRKIVSRLPRSKSAISTLNLLKIGKETAHSAKWMSDAEWDAVPLKEKRSFCTYVAEKLKDAPLDLTEQQRRRYYEQTLRDPSLDNPHETVRDTLHRVKLGLPVDYRVNNRVLGVSQAIFDSGDAHLFDPSNARKIENAMNHVKQLFIDYVNKKKEGVSTENERRHLANVSAQLNYETQKHLADMFKLAEHKVRETILEKRRKWMKEIARVKHCLRRRAKVKENARVTKSCASSACTSGLPAVRKKKHQKRTKQRAVRMLGTTYGLSIPVVRRITQVVKAQEEFLRMCEVMTRMTVGHGFFHTSKDETLDEYVNSLRDVYSADPLRIARLDAVQYVAALEAMAPVEWARRWFESALLAPLMETPEYSQLERLLAQTCTEHAEPSTKKERRLNKSAESRRDRVLKLAEKMFVPSNAAALQSVHEKRLRYIAYLHMESQIRRMRENAQLFEGIESSREAERCRELYKKLQECKKIAADPSNPFTDEQVRSIFSQIHEIVKSEMSKRVAASKATQRLKRARRVFESIRSGSVLREMNELHRQKKQEQVERMLRLLEKDVREDMLWLANIEESERPSLLPIPEPMSYVSAADVQQWRALREARERQTGNPFATVKRSEFTASFLGHKWQIPKQPLLFWGTGAAAIEQALRNAAEDAERRRKGEEIVPPYPCAENPWGWRQRKSALDDDFE